MVQVYRKLGLHDRYSLARCNLGFPPIVAVVSSMNIPEGEAVESQVEKIASLLSTRISRLLEVVPLLSCNVIDIKTREPKWSRSDREVTSGNVLQLNPIQTSESASASASGQVPLQQILSQQWKLGSETLKPDREPLWRVDIHYQKNSSKIYVGLAVNHTLIDGKGSFNLYKILISPQPQFDLSKDLTRSEIDLLRGSKEIPDASDVSHNMRPGLAVLIPTILNSLIVPRLPSFIKRLLEERPFWPYKLGKEIQECEPKMILLQFKDRGFVKDLKEACQKVGSMKTIHATISSAIMVGILSLALTEEKDRIEGDGSRPDGFDPRDSRQKILIKCDTPINIRKPENGLTVGNYVSGFVWSGPLNGDSLFWKFTKEHDDALNSKDGRKKALAYLGMLEFIPDGEKAEPTDREPTGWETFFNQKKKFGGSFSNSNLGAMPSLLLADSSRPEFKPIVIEELAWCQTPSVFSNALSVDVCGLKEDDQGEGGGLSIAIGFREGSLSEAAVEKIAKVAETTLRIIAQGKVGKDARVKDLI